MKKFVLGIDVGGTNIKLGVVNDKGRIINRSYLVTKTFTRSRGVFIDRLVKAVQDFLLQHNYSPRLFTGIGIGLPGLIDPQKGMVISLTNIPGWRNVPLAKILQKKLHIPTFIDNDVNLFTLGEWRYGAGKRAGNLVCITLGTGVGGGLILGNKLYRGTGFAAGEVGHMPLNEFGQDCNCGGFGCFERFVGNVALNDVIQKIFKRKEITLKDVYILAKKGNQLAIRFWEETAIHIGNALTGVVNLLNPNYIIIGGGISNAEHFIFKTIRKVIKRRAMKVQGAMVKVVRAQLGDDAGVIGARELVGEMRPSYE